MFLSALLTVSLGLLKEVLDVSLEDGLPWCDRGDMTNDDCHKFDIWNILVEINGISAALVTIVCFNCLRHRKASSSPCDGNTVDLSCSSSLCEAMPSFDSSVGSLWVVEHVDPEKCEQDIGKDDDVFRP